MIYAGGKVKEKGNITVPIYSSSYDGSSSNVFYVYE
jgi:hypothetical protein